MEKEAVEFKGTCIFGSVKIVEDRKIEDGKIWLGGHAIHRDLNGTITKITEPEFHGYITFETKPSVWKTLWGKFFRSREF